MCGRVYAALLLGALVGVASAADVALTPEECHRPFPTFVWTGTEAGELAKLGYQHQAMDAEDVFGVVMEAALDVSSIESVVVVLSEGEAYSTSSVSAAAGGASRGGATLHAQSAASTFPYTYPSANALSEVVNEVTTKAGFQFKVSSLEEALVSSTVKHEEGVIDCVLVKAPSEASVSETDAAVASLAKNLEESTNGKYLLLWTGGMHGEGCGRRFLTSEAATRRRLATALSARTIKITPDILSGLLFLLLFLFVLVTGLGCLGDIECPQSFATVQPAAGKEY